MPKLPAHTSPLLLPEAGDWHSEDDVAAYARECLAVLGLAGWIFGWDKTIRRLGCCKVEPRRISLSIYYVRRFLEPEPAQVMRTLLHELAHALAWVHCRSIRHDAAWHRYCTQLGIGDEKACTRCADFTPPERLHSRVPRYMLCHRETGEVFRYFYAKPVKTMRRIRRVYIPGRMRETLGYLCIRPCQPDGGPAR